MKNLLYSTIIGDICGSVYEFSPERNYSKINLTDSRSDFTDDTVCTLAVADALRGILERPLLSGTFHMTCEGEASWYEFACEIFRQRGIDQKVIPCTTSEFPRPAPRPANSRLEKRMLRLCGLPPMPDWRDALRDFLAGEF